MLLKLLKLNANDAIINGATATRRSGSVNFRKTCHAPPPSTSAASINSLGIDCRAPRETRKKYGTVSHTLTRITERRAQFGSNNHGMLVWKARFTTPKSSLSRPCQTSKARKAGTAYGMIRSARYVRWKLSPGLFSVIASSKPSANERKTTEVAKIIVQTNTLRNGLRISGLWMIRPKFLIPT